MAQTLGKIAYARGSALRVLHLDTAQVEVVEFPDAEARQPSWHPSGAYMAYTRIGLGDVGGGLVTTTPGETWLWDVSAGDKARRLSTEGVSAAFPAWAPEGNRLLFTAQGAQSQLFLHDFDANQTIHLGLPFPALQASWHPDGSAFVCVGVLDTGKHIFRVDLGKVLANEGAEAVRQLTTTGQFNHSPAWSRDGRYIAFSRFDEARKHWGIVILTAEGELVLDITGHGDSEADDHRPTWGPVGFIAFEREQNRVRNIFTCRLEDGKLGQLSTDGGTDPDWWLPAPN
ncbi:Tol-Pal system protein TolB [Anaerolineae bacterium]|nr:Tol-Pal system protein TolB [Anaerolineae bacterium]